MDAVIKARLNDYLTEHDLTEGIKHLLGDQISVKLVPAGETPRDYIYLGLLKLIGDEVLETIFDEVDTRDERYKRIRKAVLSTVGDILSDLIVDMEHKVES